MRLFDSESGRLIGTRIVGTGGGYSSHSAKPVHFGLPEGVSRVDVEATFLIAAQRIVVRVDQVDPNPYLGDYLEIRR